MVSENRRGAMVAAAVAGLTACLALAACTSDGAGAMVSTSDTGAATAIAESDLGLHPSAKAHGTDPPDAHPPSNPGTSRLDTNGAPEVASDAATPGTAATTAASSLLSTSSTTASPTSTSARSGRNSVIPSTPAGTARHPEAPATAAPAHTAPPPHTTPAVKTTRTTSSTARSSSRTAPHSSVTGSAHGHVIELRPDGKEYQDAIASLKPGDTLELHQGTYPGYAKINVSGTASKPITIRAYGHGEKPPVLRYAGTSQNHWEIRGSHLRIEGLKFDTPATYSIRIRPPSSGHVADVTLRGNTFVGCGDGCVSANDAGATYTNIRMVDNLMLGAKKTPVYIGNHQGKATFNGFTFTGNVIDARSIVSTDVVGYGIEVKLGVHNAVLRNNYVVGARGPGIMTYGLRKNISGGSVIEANVVIGSCTDRNILVGAGPATLRHNLSIGGHSGGIGLQDYGGWHRLFGVSMSENTAVVGQPADYVFPAHAGRAGMSDFSMTDNVAYTGPGSHGFAHLPPSGDVARVSNNTTAAAPPSVRSAAASLATRVPSPQALKSVWPLLSHGPLDAAALSHVLETLAALPTQSSSTAARSCG